MQTEDNQENLVQTTQAEPSSENVRSALHELTFGFESIFRPEFDSICSHLEELK